MKESSRKKILFLIHTLGGGGAEKVLVDLVTEIDKNKFDVTVMTVLDTGIYRRRLPLDVTYKSLIPFPRFRKSESSSGSLLARGTKPKLLLARIYTFLWRRTCIAKLLAKRIGGYDIEVAFLEGICAKIISETRSKARKIAWIHVDLIAQRKSENVFRSNSQERDTYLAFDKVACVSEEVRQSFVAKFGFTGATPTVDVLHNPLNVAEITNLSRKEASGFHEKMGALNLVNVGRLNAQKGHLRLLEALARCKNEGCCFVLHLIGEGTHEAKLKEYCLDNGLEDDVVFYGFRSNPYSLMARCDLYVCSSLAEGLSTTVLEARVLQLPVLTTDCAGMSEILENGAYGMIVENSAEGLYRGLKSVFLGDVDLGSYRALLSEKKVSGLQREKIRAIEEFCLSGE